MKKSIELKYSDFPQPEEKEDLNDVLLNMINMGLRINPSASAAKMNLTVSTLNNRLVNLESKGLITSRVSTIKSRDGLYRRGRIYEKLDSNNRNRPERPKRN